MSIYTRAQSVVPDFLVQRDPSLLVKADAVIPSLLPYAHDLDKLHQFAIEKNIPARTLFIAIEIMWEENPDLAKGIQIR